MSILKLNNVVKCYEEKVVKTTVLNGVNLSVEKGELIAIMGPSGSGKSTLLNIIGCLDVQTSGEYYIKDKLVSNLKEKEISKIRNSTFGFVFQNFNLLYDFNLIDNVALPLKYSSNKKNTHERCKQRLIDVGLGKHINKTPDLLSGGEKQRVAIARALVNEPEIILADEPTGALDVETGKEIMKLLKEVNEDGKTVIIITHDINIANQCKRTIKIVDGKIIG